jgi:hypothetical protein
MPGTHAEDCDDDGCRGCGRAQAADGVYLCRLCVKRLGHDAFNAAWRYEALGRVLTGQGGSGDVGYAVGENAGLSLTDAAVELRTAIKATLVSIVRTIAEERGITLPSDHSEALAAFILTHQEWLAAHDAADEHARDLRDIATDPTAFRMAFPSSRDSLFIGECTLPAATESGERQACGTRLYQKADELLVTCSGCGVFGSVEWWQQQITGETGGVVDAYAAAAHLAMRWHRPVDPALVRKWGLRYTDAKPLDRPDLSDPEPDEGKRRRLPVRDDKGRVLFQLDGLLVVARRLWGPPWDELAQPTRGVRHNDARSGGA